MVLSTVGWLAAIRLHQAIDHRTPGRTVSMVRDNHDQISARRHTDMFAAIQPLMWIVHVHFFVCLVRHIHQAVAAKEDAAHTVTRGAVLLADTLGLCVSVSLMTILGSTTEMQSHPSVLPTLLLLQGSLAGLLCLRLAPS